MRKALAAENGERKTFVARFARLGRKTNFRGYTEETILLTDVVDAETGVRMTDHIWFGYGDTFVKASLVPGDRLQFDARIKAYQKGYVNKKIGINRQSTDFKLSHPTNVQKIKSGA